MQYIGKVISGSGGAGPAFRYENYRRCNEINITLGIEVMPGTLNVELMSAFHWDNSYIPGELLELDKGVGKPNLDGDWTTKLCRFYPMRLWANNNNFIVYVMRFDEDMNRYPANFIELISDDHIRTSARIKTGDNILLTEI